MTRIAYITYNYKSAKVFMEEIIDKLKQEAIVREVNFNTLDIITDEWHITIIPTNCGNIVAKTFCMMDYACSNWRNEISNHITGKEEGYCAEREHLIKTRIHPKTEWVDIGRLKEIIGVV